VTATANVEPTTTVASVPSRIREWARRTPDKVALREKRFGIWQDITWGSYWDTVELVAHCMFGIGLFRVFVFGIV
jgi:long-chain acyl-CoA synthetase